MNSNVRITNECWKFIQFHYIINNQLIQVHMSFDMRLSLLYHQMYKDNIRIIDSKVAKHRFVTVENSTVHNNPSDTSNSATL